MKTGDQAQLVAKDMPLRTRWMTVPVRGTIWKHGERGQMVDLEYEERAWVCVFCNEPQHYVLINGSCAIGCGAAHHYYNGRRADHCHKPECVRAGNAFLGVAS